jgi:hypothetical protein
MLCLQLVLQSMHCKYEVNLVKHHIFYGTLILWSSRDEESDFRHSKRVSPSLQRVQSSSNLLTKKISLLGDMDVASNLSIGLEYGG